MSLKTNQFSLAIRLILALTLLAGMFAWLPQPAQAAAADAPTAAAKWGAKLVNHTVIINGSGFPASHTFIVRAKYRSGEPFTRLGKVKASKQGKINNVAVQLPSVWYTVTQLQVCLKDSTTNKSSCVSAKR